ncbi:Peptidase S12 Pab87-related C-terminal [Penicillium bovifimosum]|uniref:Peptidase S12 Pab87-related C-terminal n=1 Tax=Penicillium bovifimosum TaxID=126998 RepID=A0A9W9KW34_9EURO|nr:Peptidase S12 Pab87-related C-terminal [Penicillium bovifimosum]KAJ5124329.1 Peptidase S12 Pab87-related C-terminal [Penicillium bovifimosum]
MSSDRSPFDDEFNELVKEQLEKWKVPGLSIAIINGSNTYSNSRSGIGSSQTQQAYGQAELPNRNRNRPARAMTTDALFATCSTTKAFTGAATSIVIQDSKKTSDPIDWDTTLSSLIPEDFVLEDDYTTKNITLEDALSHRSGMPHHNWQFALFPMQGVTLASLVRAMRYMPLVAPLRTKYHYSNNMYLAVSHALETRTGEGLGALMKNRIWDPLGMAQTYFSPGEARADTTSTAEHVQAYDWISTADGGRFVERPEHDWEGNSGAGAIVSNVLDYARWVREFIERNGPLKGHDSLTVPRTIILHTGDVDLPSPYRAYALGWVVDNYRGQHLYSHSGGWPGYSSWVGFVPEKKFGIVVMGNSSSARFAVFRVVTYLLDRYLGLTNDQGYQEKIAASLVRQADSWKRSLETEDIKAVKQRLFSAGLPDPPIPHALHLSRYTGTYEHLTNVTVTFKIGDDGLIANLWDRAIPCDLSLQHVSGEFFVGSLLSEGHTLMPPFTVEFYINPAGVVSKVGLHLESTMKPEEKLWFVRSES